MSKLIKNTFIYTAGNILPQAVGFLLLPIYTKCLAPTDYGIINSMAVLISFLGIIFTLCLERSIYRLFFDYKEIKDQRDFLGTIFFGVLFNSAIFLVLIFIFKNIVGKIYKSIDFYPFYAYAVMTCFLSIFAPVPKIYLQVKEQAGKFVILALAEFFIVTALNLWFVWHLKAGAAGQLKAGLISASVLFPVYVLILSRIVNLKVNFRVLKHALLFSVPMIPSLLTAWVLNMSSRIFIERYFTLADVGIYSLGFKLAMVGVMVISGFDVAYSPYFFKMANANDQPQNKRKLEEINNKYIIVLLSIIFFIALFSKEVVQFFLDSRYIKAYLITRILAFAYFFSGLSGMISRSILQEKKTKQDMCIAVGAAGLNILFSFILIPRFGMYGAACATLLAYLAGFSAEYQYSKRCYFIPINWKQFVKYFGIACSLIVVYQLGIEKYLLFSLISKGLLLAYIVWFVIFKTLHADTELKVIASRVFKTS